MKLISDVFCNVYGTKLAAAGDLVKLINIYGKIAIVATIKNERFPCSFQNLTCPLTPDNYKPSQPVTTPKQPVKKAKKSISNRMQDVIILPPQTTLF